MDQNTINRHISEVKDLMLKDCESMGYSKRTIECCFDLLEIKLKFEFKKQYANPKEYNLDKLNSDESLLQHYQNYCTKKLKSNDMVVFLLGLGEETGEVLQIFKKARRDNKEINVSKVTEEIGDVLWYISNICSKLNLSLKDVIKYNINKLETRYDQ